MSTQDAPSSQLAMRNQAPQSPAPRPAPRGKIRRRLLLVYIHGFMGDETSFRSFPAHIHNLIAMTLSDSHVIHTKVYPRYASKHTIQMARDCFAAWLAPHTDPWTEIILLSHSMGGLVAADTVLLLRFNIIGTINLDVPFIGLSPSIIATGLASIFNPVPVPHDATVQEYDDDAERPVRIATFSNPNPSDPNYNPSYHNDIHLPVRKGWENTLHWMNKNYKQGLRHATKGLIKSHLKFGSAMGDWHDLKNRYANVRALEESDENKRKSNHPQLQSVPRVRFINYYTVSTGRPKKPKPPKSPKSPRPTTPQPHDTDEHLSSLATASQQATNESATTPPEPELPANNPTSLDKDQDLHSNDMVPFLEPPTDLPEIPPIPQEPPFVDLAQFSDRTQRRVEEKKHEQALKEYQKAVKARNKVIHQRHKLEEKWAKQKKQKQKDMAERVDASLQPEPENNHSQAEPERIPLVESERTSAESDRPHTDSPRHLEASSVLNGIENDVDKVHLSVADPHAFATSCPFTNYEFSRSTIMAQAPPDEQPPAHRPQSPHSGDERIVHKAAVLDPEPSTKKKALKRFCLLPPRDVSGHEDHTWIPVFMAGMDEVTAHTSLFYVNETYERLVGDVSARIEEWTREVDSVRLAREMVCLDGM